MVINNLNNGGIKLFEWKEKYSVGVEKFDDQHKELLRIGRDLVSAFEGTEEGIDQYDLILDLLNEMQEYTVYHFESEEKAMKEADYPELEKHKKIHQKFVNKLKEIDTDKIDKNQQEFSMELLNFLATWIEEHILGEDQKYTPYMNN